MMRGRGKGSAGAVFSPVKEVAAVEEWEVRPGGMLVQKRTPDGELVPAAPPVPAIRVKVKYASAYHEIYLSPASSFGELKKLLAERTGLHPGDQKLVYKGKERDSAAYLDTSGVKDRAKMVLLEDTAAQAKRFLEMRRAATMEKASKSISQISSYVDKLTSKVSAVEAIVSKGGKVVEQDVANLIELLMMQLVNLDGIVADGDVKQQRGAQVRRVQKYVERLDLIKIKNAAPPPKSNGQAASATARGRPPRPQQQQQKQPQASAAVAKTEWELFDSLFGPVGPPSTSVAAATNTTMPAAAAAANTTTTTTAPSAPPPRFDWELF